MTKLLAYYDPHRNIQSTLEEHSRNVSNFLAIVFRDRLRSNNPVFKLLDNLLGIDDFIYKTTLLSGYLHDLGKASRYYQANLNKRGFRYHEHLSAIILLSTREYLLDQNNENCALIFHLASAIVSRHHVAMINRHPDMMIKTLKENPNITRVLIEAMKNIEAEDINYLLKPLPLPIREAINSGVEKLKTDITKQNPMILAQRRLSPTTTKSITHDIPRYIADIKAEPKGRALDKAMILKTIQSATGALIVSDILVAWKERGEADPQSAYAKSWLIELNANDSLEKITTGEIKGEFVNKLTSLSVLCIEK